MKTALYLFLSFSFPFFFLNDETPSTEDGWGMLNDELGPQDASFPLLLPPPTWYLGSFLLEIRSLRSPGLIRVRPVENFRCRGRK